jgi:hypothetical protein
MKKEVKLSPVVGTVISLIDSWIAEASNWFEWDDLGSNSKIYKCNGGNTEFYLQVDDNFTTYCKVKLWESWNNETHAGSGAVTPFKCMFKSTDYYRCIGDNKYICVYDYQSTSQITLFYAGYITPLLSEDTKAIYITGNNTTSSGDSLCFCNNQSLGSFLFSFSGGLPVADWSLHAYITDPSMFTINNQSLVLFYVYLGEYQSNKKVRGFVPNIFGVGPNPPSGLTAGDNIYIGDTPYQLVRKSSSPYNVIFIKNA